MISDVMVCDVVKCIAAACEVVSYHVLLCAMA